jgi:DNA-directed RNA polymerase specialized sigma subunit
VETRKATIKPFPSAAKGWYPVTKEELKEYLPRQKELRRLEEIMARIKVQMTSPYVSDMSRLRGGGLGGEERIVILMDKLRTLYDEYTKLWDSQIDRQRDIEAAIGTLSAKERDILRMRYFQERSWVSIGLAIHCSERTAQRLGAVAEEKLFGPEGATRTGA